MPHLVGAPAAATLLAEPAVDRLVAALLAAQRPDGGWGAIAGRPSNTEATAYGTVALAGIKFGASDAGEPRAAAARGSSWLIAHQRPDGSWPATEQVLAASWMTSAAVLALALLGEAPTSVRRGAGWLLEEEGTRFDWRTRLALWLSELRGAKQPVDVDVTLRGWPWASGSFSWVEPTALAMLALRAVAGDAELGSSRQRAYRLDQGEQLLADRMVPSGGWNYGNSRVLDEDLDPYPDTTAWALLALRGTRRAGLVEPGFAALGRLMRDNSSVLARALTVLALRAHGRDATAAVAALADQCAGGPLPGEARTRALAALALSQSTFPFAAVPRA
jgi:squalene cyclase